MPPTSPAWRRSDGQGLRAAVRELEDGFAWTVSKGTRILRAGHGLPTREQAIEDCEAAWSTCSSPRA